MVEKLGYELCGHARAAQKYEAYMSEFGELEQTATKMGRISPMYLMSTWEVISMKQMNHSNVSLHLPTETRIPMLINKILALYPELSCSAVLFHILNTAHLLNQLEKTAVPRGGGQGVNTFLTPTVAHFMP